MLLSGLFDPAIIRLIENSSRNNEDIRLMVKKVLKIVGVDFVTQSGSLPNDVPLLIVSNHPGVFDSLILISSIKRNDFYFVAITTYGIFGPAVKAKLLPIYRRRQFNHYFFEYPLTLQLTNRLPKSFKLEEMRALNRETIRQAAQMINKGYAVSIFPTGSAGKQIYGSKWKAGIGYLIKQIKQPKTKVIFCHISGTQRADIYAYMRPFIRKLFFKTQPVSIHYSKTFSLNKIVDLKKEPKEIAKDLETKYEEFQEKIMNN